MSRPLVEGGMTSLAPGQRASVAVPHEDVSRAVMKHRDQIVQRWAERHFSDPVLVERISRQLDTATAADYQRRYLRPLLALFAQSLGRRAPDEIRAVYLDERARFLGLEDPEPVAPSRAHAQLAADAADVHAALGNDPGLAASASELLTQADAALTERETEEVLRVALIGDCLMSELRSFLVASAATQGFRLRPHHFYFSADQGVGLASDAVKEQIRAERIDLLIMSFFTYEGLPPFRAYLADAASLGDAELQGRSAALVRLVSDTIADLRAVTTVPILLNGVCGLPLRRWRKRVPVLSPLSASHRRAVDVLNEDLRQLADHVDNVIFVDQRAIAPPSRLRALNKPLVSPRLVGDETLFHTSRFASALAQEHSSLMGAYRRLRATKVLLVDFDNTLWDGVMADGPVTHNRDAQLLLRSLRQGGILLVAVSKNDPAAVRWEEMALSKDDFVLHKISWGHKATAIEEVTAQLDLHPSSFVLIDDNPAERAMACAHLPALTVLDPTDPQTWDELALLLRFPATRATEESARRTEMYREAAARRQALSSTVDYPAMMRSLELSARMRLATEDDLDRLHELVARTSQFNTTTLRRSRADIASLLDDADHSVYVASLGDRFGNLGIVGLVILEHRGPCLIYDSVIMSCRAMGFGLEKAMIRVTLDAAPGATAIIGRYTRTDRNGPCSDLFPSAGFRSGDNEWRADRDQVVAAIPPWLDLELGSLVGA